jgi:GNAT superfamily N-acetyltransferase
MADIYLLKEFPDYASILAYWAYGEWYTLRDIPFEIVIKAYKQRMNDTIIPITWVAVENEFPVGMVSLKTDDLWSRKDINPWLSSLFILPEYRNKGIAEKLINTVIKKSAELNYKNLYLFTDPDNAKISMFYEKKGWKFLEKEKGNNDKPVNIFFFKNIYK